MINAYNAVYNTHGITLIDLLEWIKSKDICTDVSNEALRAKLERVKVKSNKLRGRKRDDFLDENFVFPRRTTSNPSTEIVAETTDDATELCPPEENLTAIRLKKEKKAMKRKIKRQDVQISNNRAKIAKISNDKKVFKCREEVTAEECTR